MFTASSFVSNLQVFESFWAESGDLSLSLAGFGEGEQYHQAEVAKC
jgi:hypothetical protein